MPLSSPGCRSNLGYPARSPKALTGIGHPALEIILELAIMTAGQRIGIHN
nr:hypothetical protein [uncultured bacterium]